MPQSDLIRLTRTNGRAEFVDVQYLYINRGHFILKFNKRGHLRSAREKHRSTLAPLTHDGESFRQSLDAGKVWALRGTRGSGGDEGQKRKNVSL